ncbi:MAG: transglutaminase family protein [Ruminococcus sp.]
MKKENINLSGIKINDSITMSVRHRRKNLRELESLFIALCGYSGIIMFFLNTFTIPFDIQTVLIFSVIFALLYGTATALRGKAMIIFPVTFALMGFGAFRYYSQIKSGFCLVFNIMYKKFTDTGINYFKSVSPLHTEHNITIFLIFAVWILSAVIFFFTVYRPNILVIVAVTFPIIEMCLYYGIEVPVIWTVLTASYWFALLSVCTSDLGEYYGGGGGFTRKDDVFFPKRKMKFKVTEKCGIWIIAVSMISAVATNIIIDITGYERTDKIKQQRKELKTAINSFSMEDFASSVSDITESLGFSFEYQDNRLGKFNKITYKGKTDLIITLDEAPENGLYLKGFTASEYGDNEWIEPDSEKYSNINAMFEKYNIYPQQIPYMTDTFAYEKSCKIKISSQKKSRKYYVPYAVVPDESFSFIDDKSITRNRDKTYSFEFYSPDIKKISENLNLTNIKIDLDYYHQFTDEQNQTIRDFSEKYNMNMLLSNRENLPVLLNYNSMMSMLIENQYRNFVYENYLSYPDNDDFKEIYNAYSDILENAPVSTTYERLETLQKIKDKINSEVEYTLEPGKTPSTRDFTNYFLLENKKGYCVHYATAGVMLARMAGIPARYATGYVSVGDDYNESNKNPDGSYTVKLPDSRSHAWAEIYLDGYGWIPFEFTAGYSSLTIDSEHPESVTTAVTETPSEITATTTALTSSSITQSALTKNSGTSKTGITSTVITSLKITENTVSSAIIPVPDGNGNISDSFKKIFAVIFVFLLIFARRWIIIGIRSKRLNSGNSGKRVINNYRYVIKLLKYLKLKQDNLQYSEFSDIVEEKLSGEYFKEGCFSSFSGIAMKSAFGNSEPTKEELEFLSAFSKELAGNIYRKSNIFVRIYLKLISVLI